MSKKLLLPKKVAKIGGVKKALKTHHHAGMKKMATSAPAIQSVSMTMPPEPPSNAKADITQTIKAAVKKHAGSKKNMSLTGIKSNPTV